MGLKHNMRQARQEVAGIRKRVVRAVGVGGDAAAVLWFAETQLRVPKETTALMNSGELNDSHSGSRFSWIVTYGNSQVQGVGVYYAAAVHEKVGAFHAPPTGAKYVEFPLLQAKDSFKKLITQAVRKAV